MGVAIADFDDDGFIDIFVANGNERNFLFHNLAGKAFAETGVSAGVAYTGDGVPSPNMGADFCELNNYGLPDIIYTALAGKTFSVRLNKGKSPF